MKRTFPNRGGGRTQRRQERPKGFTIFDLLCFVAACSVIFPVALIVSRRCEGRWRVVVFCFFMCIVYPALGVAFVYLMRRFFRWDYNRRHASGTANEGSTRSERL
jgi:predicted Na+-dependent transporter